MTVALFSDRTAAAGVDFTYRNGQEAGHFAILESMGGGVGLIDYDRDGDLDLFAPGGGEYGSNQEIRGRSPVLYRNEGDWNFDDVTALADADHAPHYSHGVAVGDFNGDGFPDLLVTGYGGLLLLRNAGDGTFEVVTSHADLDDKLWSISAAWGDIDGDGDLDLYVTHYVNWSFDNHPFCPGKQPGQRDVCPPRSFDPLPDSVYENQGDGVFRDISRAIGLKDGGKGIGVLMADLDLDGDLDIYVGNDTVPNYLYENDGKGHLKDVALWSGTALSCEGTTEGSMGVDLGDFNQDGLPDLWVANYENESFSLYRNDGHMAFQHVSQTTGIMAVGDNYVGWGTVFLDFDRDGDLDLFCSNGHVIRYPTQTPVFQRPLLLENLDGKRFENITLASGGYLTRPHMGRGVATGDLDNDGDLDLVLAHMNQPLTLLSNETPNQNRWISLQLVGTRNSRDAVGAVIRVKTAHGEQTRQVKSGTSYASSSDPRVFFGLADADQIERIEIRWPSGIHQTLTGISPNQVLVIAEPPERASAVATTTAR